MIPVPVAQDDPVDLRDGDFECGDVPLDGTWVGAGVEEKAVLDPSGLCCLCYLSFSVLQIHLSLTITIASPWAP